jgi:DNA-binding CsgD family transcriptional regulator
MTDSMHRAPAEPAATHDTTTANALESAALRYGLSGREREIAQLLVEGYAALNAAAILELSEHTVRTYVRRLYKKLNVSNRADLVCRLLTAPA